MSIVESVCLVCGSQHWLDLPNPHPSQSVTTAGRIVGQPLGKAQCACCGFGQRVHKAFLGLSDYYENDYATYYDKPGAALYHEERYRVLSEWMASFAGSSSLSRIIDVGCGQGWAMEAMRRLYPHAVIEGLDPSTFNAEVARARGFEVITGKLGELSIQENAYDLVYSNNVVQHVTDPKNFFSALKRLVKPDGLILVTCPDGLRPNVELLWSDQNFSFLPQNLMGICEEVGFESISWVASPISASLPPAQLLALSKSPKSSIRVQPACIDLDEVFRSRTRYLGAFPKIDAYLKGQLASSTHVYNFGASYWSTILAAYCPEYWDRVSACLVDGNDHAKEPFHGKDVCSSDGVAPASREALVLGTSPVAHKTLVDRFSASWRKVVSWDGFLEY